MSEKPNAVGLIVSGDKNPNLICLCSSCNSKANFGRHKWQKFYESLMKNRSA